MTSTSHTDSPSCGPCASRPSTVALMDRPIHTTDIDIQPLRVAVPVAGYAALDLELQVLEGTDVEVRVLTGMQTDSEEGWIEVDRFVPTSAVRSVRKPFFPLLKYVRWEVLTATAATFYIQGMGRRRLGFIPTEIDGCILWLRSDLSVTVSSNNVSQWSDRSGSEHHATQATGAVQPGYKPTGWKNGLPTIDFDRANSEIMSLGTMSDSATSYTVLAVVNQRNQTTGRQDLIGTKLPTRVIAQVTSGSAGVGIYDGTWKPTGAEVNGEQVLTWLIDGPGAGFECFRNGKSIGSNSYAGSWGWDTPRLGGLDGGTQYIDAEVAEVIVYNRKLAESELARVHSYLLARYGL